MTNSNGNNADTTDTAANGSQRLPPVLAALQRASHSMMTTTTSNGNHVNGNDSVVSGLSGDENQTVASKRSIWSQAASILRGELPVENQTIPEEENAELLGRSVPGGTTTTNGNEALTVDTLLQNEENKVTEVVQLSPSIQEVLDSSERLARVRSGEDNEEINNGDGETYINFLLDDPKTMTYSRRLALFLMKRYAWYNPALKPQPEDEEKDKPLGETKSRPLPADSYPFTHSKRERPSLAKAWSYFDHVALSRYVVYTNPNDPPKPQKCLLTRIYRKLFCKAGKQLKRAEPGEREHPTALYEPIFTPHKQLGDFGLGLGLYFSTLRAITVLTLLAGLLNIPNFGYFNSDAYSPLESNFDSYVNDTVPNRLLQGSAICTDVSWVVCLDCDDSSSRYGYDNSRRAVGVNNETNSNMTFYLRNNCTPDNIQASMINYATLLLIMVGTILLNMYLRRMEIAYDEDEQTAQDYSIVIENPPGDATDPAEWRDFFYENFDGAHVTACTVAVDNDLLVRSLVERREKLRIIELLVEPGTSMDTLTLAGIAAHEERHRRFFGNLKALLVPGVPELFGRVAVLNAKVQGLAQQDYPATNVFVTFETEQAQRAVLEALNLGSLDVRRNKTAKVANPKHLFRGEKVLQVAEPGTSRCLLFCLVCGD